MIDFYTFVYYLNLIGSIITILMFSKNILRFLFKKLIHIIYIYLKEENERDKKNDSEEINKVSKGG